MNLQTLREHIDEEERKQLESLIKQAEWSQRFSVVCKLITEYESETGETLVLTSKGMKRSKSHGE